MRRLLLGLAIASIAVLSPCWVHADDQQIAQQIVQQLRQQKADGQLTGFGIDLEVESGIVWLKGHVRSPEQQAMVLDIARRVDGVQQVVNDLHDQATPPQPPSRNRSVKTALLKTESSSSKPAQEAEPIADEPAWQRAACVPAGSHAKRPRTAGANTDAPAPGPALEEADNRPDRKLAQHPTVDSTAESPGRARVAGSRLEPRTPSDEQLAETIIGRLRTQKDRGILQELRCRRPSQRPRRVGLRPCGFRSAAQPGAGRLASRAWRQAGCQRSEMSPVRLRCKWFRLRLKPAAPVTQRSRAPVGTAVARNSSSGTVPIRSGTAAHASASQAPLAFAPAQSVAYNQQIRGQPVA